MICPYCSNDNMDIVSETKDRVFYHCKRCHNFTEGDVIVNVGVDTSKAAYKEVLEDGTANTQKDVVFKILRATPNLCIREISELTGMQKSSVSPRLNELKAEGKVVCVGTKFYKGKEVEIHKVVKYGEEENIQEH